MLLLDIEVPETRVVTKTDRELLFDGNDIFIYIDTYMDYLKEFNSRQDLLSKKTNYKAIAEYLPIITKELHSVTAIKRPALKIINKSTVVLNLPFAPKVVHKGKTYIGPINTPIEVDDFKLVPIFDINPKSIEDVKDIVRLRIEPETIFEDYVPYVVNLEPKRNRVYDFLTSKPASEDPIVLRYSFDIDNNLRMLENILHAGIENVMPLIKSMHANADKIKTYNQGINKLLRENARLTRLEQMCKVKFPNLFNKNSKEYIFGNFDLEAMPANYKKALLAEYNSRMLLEEKMITNKCEHVIALNSLRAAPTKANLKALSNMREKNGNCSMCELQLICPHELEYFEIITQDSSLKQMLYKVEQAITTKYADLTKSKLYASFCKLCGMKILDMSSSEDTANLDDYSNGEMSQEEINVRQITFANLMFVKPVSRTTMFKVASNVWESVKDVVSEIANQKAAAKDKEINIIILVIASLVSMSFQSDYIAIKDTAGKKAAREADPRIKTSIATLFRDSLEIFKIRYAKALKDSSYYNKPEVVKQLFSKAYKLIKDKINVQDNQQITQTEKTSDAYLKIQPKSDYGIKSKKQFEDSLKSIDPTPIDEKNLIEAQTKSILYPFSHIKYSYDRYYKQATWNKDMALYACPATAKRHKWNTYILSDGNERKISDMAPNLKKVTYMRCADCGLSTKELVKNEATDISSIVDEKNKINSFYRVFRYRCIKEDFHIFVKDQCTRCNMKFEYIKNKDQPFFKKHEQYLEKYNQIMAYEKNKVLVEHKEFNGQVADIKHKAHKFVMHPESYEWTQHKMEFSNIANTEGKNEHDYFNTEIEITSKNDVLTKLIDRLRQLLIYIGILANKPSTHKYQNNQNFKFVDQKTIISKIYNDIIQEKITETAWKQYNIKHVKGAIIHIMKQLKQMPEAFKFATDFILESDLLFTNYDYAEIRKTFNLSKIIEDSFNSNLDMELQDEDLQEINELFEDQE